MIQDRKKILLAISTTYIIMRKLINALSENDDEKN